MHRTDKPSGRRRTSTNCVGTNAFAIVLRKKNPVIWSYAGTSTSLRKTLMSTIRTSGAERLWRRRANARRFENYATLAYRTRFESITKKANFIAGGIIRCAHSKKIAAYASMQFWPVNRWQKSALRPELMAKCAGAKIHLITRLFGRSLRIKKTSTPNIERPTSNSDFLN